MDLRKYTLQGKSRDGSEFHSPCQLSATGTDCLENDVEEDSKVTSRFSKTVMHLMGKAIRRLGTYKCFSRWPLLSSVVQSCLTPCGPADCSPPGSSINGILQARNTGMGCHFLFQGIFPTQGSNPLVSSALADRFFTTAPPGKPCVKCI